SQTKSQTGTMEFLPYGARHTATGTLPHHQFTAKPYDTGTGLYNYPYRHYSPAMARWTGADPAGLVNGPNVYGYTGNSPIARLDPMGLDWDTGDFVTHYYAGETWHQDTSQRTPVDLAVVGLLDDFRAAPSVMSAVSAFKGELLSYAYDLANKCCERVRAGCTFRFSRRNTQGTDVTWVPRLFAVGDSVLVRSAQCTESIDCCHRRFGLSCGMRFSIRDWFIDPLSIGIEPGGKPYQINADWQEGFSTNSSF
ncbi:MAG: RHS repeat-associated core domain-containing protein, partial [Candidatus Hydrogenedentes bacterium]|nr:RHS repeat-associated core domain-containing protein [Candidatus Hydrogenedentota bacterium]